ncbi:MAG: hypothetical protein M1813_008463 [Trichoglossum hirsutum]|jgi:serine/threonine protein kinase|nr:MAG: hypothetical protein M1813_008463 [Trichoglossum hirsutum]
MPLDRREGSNRGHLRDYGVVKDIGRNQGGCNNGVYLMRHKREGTLLVLKLVEMSNMATAEREILLYLRGHAAIVKVIDIFVSHGRPEVMSFMIEYCDCGSLHSLINRINRHGYLLPEHFIWHALRALSSGLAFMHYGITDLESPPPRGWRHVVHRDIKPANILLKMGRHCRYPHVLFADFGVSHMSGLPYEPKYSERERWSGRSDVWTLGYTMVDLISGFNNGIIIPPEFNVERRSSPLPIRDISGGLNNVLGACLIRDIKQRVNSRELMAGVKKTYRQERPREEELPGWIWG